MWFQYGSKSFSRLGVWIWIWYWDEITMLVWDLDKSQTIQIPIDIPFESNNFKFHYKEKDLTKFRKKAGHCGAQQHQCRVQGSANSNLTCSYQVQQLLCSVYVCYVHTYVVSISDFEVKRSKKLFRTAVFEEDILDIV